MSDLAGEVGPNTEVDEKRHKIRAGLPAIAARCRQMLELAEMAAAGPDPESLLPDIAELRRVCAAFVRAHS